MTFPHWEAASLTTLTPKFGEWNFPPRILGGGLSENTCCTVLLNTHPTEIWGVENAIPPKFGGVWVVRFCQVWPIFTAKGIALSVFLLQARHACKVSLVNFFSNLFWSEKSLCPQQFLPAILGPEMAVPILWAPGKMRYFCRKKPVPIKLLVLGGWYFSDFIFMGARIFLIWTLAHQNRTIAIASDFRVDGAKSPEIPQKEGVLGSEIAARNRKSLATFHRNLKSQCSIAPSFFGNRCDFWGPRRASQSQIAKSLRFRCAKFWTFKSLMGKSGDIWGEDFSWGQKRYDKETAWQRFGRTFGRTFWCDLPQNPCFTG